MNENIRNHEEDRAILHELEEQLEEGESIMELMPAWKRWGYEEGIAEGREEGREEIIRKLLEKGFSPEEVAATLDIPVDHIRKLLK
jgi:predicted transposase/invertase (TIGR01784 family)